MKQANNKLITIFYKIAKWLVWLCFPKMKVTGRESLPEEPMIFVANHAQMNGPIACELYLPGNRYTWCAGQMMVLKEVPPYAYEDFWSQKPALTRPFYKLLSYLVAPLSVFIFNNANTIPVRRDSRLLSTFRTTVNRLEQGAQIVIFPEHDVKHNHIVYDFQQHFIDVARLYYKRTGKELLFVPLYIAPKIKRMHFGQPVRFSADTPIEDERRRLCDYLMGSITDIACSLPRHTVIPYRNIRKKDYPVNKREEA